MARLPQKTVPSKTKDTGTKREAVAKELLTKEEKVFRLYRDKALDLSRRNRLLKYPERGPKLEFDLTLQECEGYFNAPSELYVEFQHKKILDAEARRERAKKRDETASEEDFDDGTRTVLHGEKLITQISRLQRLSAKTFKEHGLNTLFLAVGEISWKLALGSRGSFDKVREQLFVAPVLLIPVSLSTSRGGAKRSVLEYDSSLYPIQVNPVLLIWMQQNDIAVPALPELSIESYTELDKILRALKARFAESMIEATTSNKIYVGQFTYHGQQIYEDLRMHEAQMLKSEFVGSICGGDPLEQETTAGAINDDESPDSYADDFFTPEEDFTIHNTDDSQIAAIRAVLSGKHMVIHGPPGTGKSQTIANIIANLLARKKKVLFVCEKQAALDVVYRYMTFEKPNLSDLCLPLYQYRAKKRNFAKDLMDSRGRIANDLKAYGTHDFDEVLDKREARLDIIKRYARAVITPTTALERSPYWIFGELARLSDTTKEIYPRWAGEPALEVLYSEFTQRMAHAADLNRFRALMTTPSHLWSDVRRGHSATGADRAILSTVSLLHKHAQKFSDLNSRITPKTIGALRRLIELVASEESRPEFGGLSTSAFFDDDLQTVAEKFEAAVAYQRRYQDLTADRHVSFPVAWVVRTSPDLTDVVSKAQTREVLSPQTQDALENVVTSLSKLIPALPVELSRLTLRDFATNARLYQLREDLLPLLQRVKGELNEAKSVLELASSLERRLEKSDTICRQYGVSLDQIDVKELSDLEQRFATQYKTVLRAFSSSYKRDRFRVEQLCVLHKPEGYRAIKEVVENATTSLRVRSQLRDELGKFITRYKLPDSACELSGTIILSEVQALLDYLEMHGLESVAAGEVALLENGALREALRGINMTLVSIEHDRAVIQPYLTHDLGDMKLKDVGKILIRFRKTLRYLVGIQEESTKYIERDDDYSLEDLQNDVEFLNEVCNQVTGLEGTGVPSRLGISCENLMASQNILSQCLVHIRHMLAIADLLNGKRTTKQLYSYTAALQENLGEARTWVDEFDSLLGQLSELIDNPSISDKYDVLSFEEIDALCATQEADRAGLTEWMRYQNARQAAEEYGLGWFINFAVERPIMEEPLENLYACSFYTEWLDKLGEQEPTLRNFDLQKHEKVIADFKKLDEQALKVNRMRILNKYKAEIVSPLQYLEAERTIRHEAEKMRQHKPIRELVEKFGPHIQETKPCWMVSPLALGSYLKYDSVEFDTVIFDEASQMTIESALGAIARAKQVVVIGDEHQLPPTSFFNFAGADEEEDDEIIESTGYESILKCAIGLLGASKTWLRYHYRSKSEDLIAFSNHYIYSYFNQPLVTFPSAVTKRGVEFLHVPGIYKHDGERNTNRVEAERIAELCIEHAKSSREKSLGVIAFSVAQEEEIRDAVQAKLKDRPDLEAVLDEESDDPSSFFITNLESVQGDERDVIFLSVCYGKDPKGTFAQRFGPLNSDYGYRRLNVAVTRARERVVCIASIHPHDIKVGEGTKRGVELLQKYLEYARDGIDSLLASKMAQKESADFDSEFEVAVAAALEKRGYVVHHQVGASGYRIDLAILHPRNKNEYVLGIECDGAAYHSSHTARERDRIRQDILENYGWRLYRIWSQHWFDHRDDVVEDIDQEVKRILKNAA